MQGEERSLREVVSIVSARAGWIAPATAGGIVLAIIVSAVTPPIYRAEMSLIAGANGATSPPDLGRIIGTWLYVLGDPTTLAGAKGQLAERYGQKELDAVRVAVRPVDNSVVIVLTVRAGDAQLALELAQAVFEVAAADEIAASFPINRLGVPQLTGAPETPKPRRNILLGAAAGFLAGLALAFFLVDLRRAGWNRPRFLAAS